MRNPRDDSETIDKASDLINSSLEEHSLSLATSYTHEDVNNQPEAFSWLSVDVDAGGIATDACYFVTYRGAEEMRQHFLTVVAAVLSDELIELYTSGRLTNITLRIGPDTLSGTNLNDENGVVLEK